MLWTSSKVTISSLPKLGEEVFVLRGYYSNHSSVFPQI